MRERELEDPAQAVHCLLKESFGPQMAPRPFRVVTHHSDRKHVLYGYAAVGAELLRETAESCQDPLMSKALPPESIESKAMPRTWRSGQTLSASLKTRPVVRLETDVNKLPENLRKAVQEGRLKPSSECDLFHWQVKKCREQGLPEPSQEEVYQHWLGRRLGKDQAARVMPGSLVVESSVVRQSRRKKEERIFAGTDVELKAVIEVVNPDSFAAIIAQGVGRHRAYGYGMVLLSPA
jgi:CRISPR system Cascade subunit CasE